MLKRRALMESISSNLHNFLKKIGNNLPVPDKKFLRDSFTGLLRCGKHLLLASQGFATEKLMRNPLSLSCKDLTKRELNGNINLSGNLAVVQMLPKFEECSKFVVIQYSIDGGLLS